MDFADFLDKRFGYGGIPGMTQRDREEELRKAREEWDNQTEFVTDMVGPTDDA